MGVVSGTVLKHGGDVTGVVPFVMVSAGGELDKVIGASDTPSVEYVLNEKGRESVSFFQIIDVFRC